MCVAETIRTGSEDDGYAGAGNGPHSPVSKGILLFRIISQCYEEFHLEFLNFCPGNMGI